MKLNKKLKFALISSISLTASIIPAVSIGVTHANNKKDSIEQKNDISNNQNAVNDKTESTKKYPGMYDPSKTSPSSLEAWELMKWIRQWGKFTANIVKQTPTTVTIGVDLNTNGGMFRHGGLVVEWAKKGNDFFDNGVRHRYDTNTKYGPVGKFTPSNTNGYTEIVLPKTNEDRTIKLALGIIYERGQYQNYYGVSVWTPEIVIPKMPDTKININLYDYTEPQIKAKVIDNKMGDGVITEYSILRREANKNDDWKYMRTIIKYGSDNLEYKITRDSKDWEYYVVANIKHKDNPTYKRQIVSNTFKVGKKISSVVPAYPNGNFGVSSIC